MSNMIRENMKEISRIVGREEIDRIVYIGPKYEINRAMYEYGCRDLHYENSKTRGTFVKGELRTLAKCKLVHDRDTRCLLCFDKYTRSIKHNKLVKAIEVKSIEKSEMFELSNGIFVRVELDEDKNLIELRWENRKSSNISKALSKKALYFITHYYTNKLNLFQTRHSHSSSNDIASSVNRAVKKAFFNLTRENMLGIKKLDCRHYNQHSTDVYTHLKGTDSWLHADEFKNFIKSLNGKTIYAGVNDVSCSCLTYGLRICIIGSHYEYTYINISSRSIKELFNIICKIDQKYNILEESMSYLKSVLNDRED